MVMLGRLVPTYLRVLFCLVNFRVTKGYLSCAEVSNPDSISNLTPGLLNFNRFSYYYDTYLPYEYMFKILMLQSYGIGVFKMA